MEGISRVGEMLLIVDVFSKESKKLYESLAKTGKAIRTLVLQDDGFLPTGVENIFDFFLGDYSAASKKGRPVYFNEVQTPDYWEISATSGNGKVCDLNKERAKIFYQRPEAHDRFVNLVDWYDESRTPRLTDHYNKYGMIYARTIFNAKGQKVNKTYFSAEGIPVIEENYVTHCLTLNYEGKTRFFQDRMQLYKYTLEKMGLEQDIVLFNTLSTSFFLSESLPPRADGTKRDILFWQEPERNDIPGNMKALFNGSARRSQTVIVQNRKAYDKLLALGADPSKTKMLGFIYPMERESNYSKNVLISTNSDQIEKLNELVGALPECHFYITAVTEMSPKLMGMGKYANVSLYPNVSNKMQEELLHTCDIYLDINHGGEILCSVENAFLNNQLIFAFEQTMHEKEYVPEDKRFQAKDYQLMIKQLKSIMDNQEVWNQELEKQRSFALAETVESYQRILEG